MQSSSFASSKSSLPSGRRKNGGREDAAHIYDELKIFTGTCLDVGIVLDRDDILKEPSYTVL